MRRIRLRDIGLISPPALAGLLASATLAFPLAAQEGAARLAAQERATPTERPIQGDEAPAPADPTLNPIARLLAEGQAVFGIFSGAKTAEGGAAMIQNRETDFVFYSMESGPFDIPAMQTYMQAMIDGAGGDPRDSHPVALRIPPIRDGRDDAQERVRRGLDAGVFSIVFPHVETPEEAEFAVRAMRYARASGDPPGLRPAGMGDAYRFWGVPEDEYRAKADLWPLNPDGELVSMILIEDQVGVENAEAIARTPGVGVVFPGPGDLRRAYQGDAVAIENAIQRVLAACKAADVPCGITAGVDDIAERLAQGFRVIIVTDPAALAVGRRAAGR